MVIDYNIYRKPSKIALESVEGFWFDRDKFEDVIDAWTPINDVATILQVTDEDLDKFCQAIYGKKFEEVYKILVGISRMGMRKAYSMLAKSGNATAINITAKEFMGMGDENGTKNVNITIKNDLKRDDE